MKIYILLWIYSFSLKQHILKTASYFTNFWAKISGFFFLSHCSRISLLFFIAYKYFPHWTSSCFFLICEMNKNKEFYFNIRILIFCKWIFINSSLFLNINFRIIFKFLCFKDVLTVKQWVNLKRINWCYANLLQLSWW